MRTVTILAVPLTREKNNCIMYIGRWNMGRDDGELGINIWCVLKDSVSCRGGPAMEGGAV